MLENSSTSCLPVANTVASNRFPFIEYAEALIDYRHQLDEQPIQEEDLSGDVEVLEESSKGAVYKLRVCHRWRPENTF